MSYSEYLERLIFPISLQTFYDEYFEKKPLLIQRAQPGYFEDILSIDDVNTYLERKDIRYPAIRMVKEGKELAQSSYLRNFPYGNQTFDRVIDNDRMFSLFSEGATIVLQALQRTMPALTVFCQQLERQFNFPVQNNIYLTPASSQGFNPHYDTHDVFVLQTFGTKKWKVFDSPVYLPKEKFNSKKWIPTEPQIETVLEQGDTLYIPRGYVHVAETADDTSMHITLGLLSYTWMEVLKFLQSKSGKIKDFRRTFEWDRTSDFDIKAEMASMFEQLMEEVSGDDIRNEFSKRLMKKTLTADKNRLMDIIMKDDVTERTQFEMRPEVNYRLEFDGEDINLSFYDKKITFPGYVHPTLLSIIDLRRFSYLDLGGKMDDEGNKVLCVKLMKEGFLTIVDNG